MNQEKLKKMQVDMLKYIVEICSNHDINYYLVGGSMLGAIRHKGIIPWDDDIDIGLPRPDYERLMKILENTTHDLYFLQNSNTDKEYPLCYAKLRNSNTTFIEVSMQTLNINHGVFIDIFPLDGYKKGKLAQRLINILQKICKYRIESKFIFDAEQESSKRKILGFIGRTLLPNINNAISVRSRLIKYYKYNDCEYITNFGGAYQDKEILPKYIFEDYLEVPFEKLSVRIPKNYELYLTHFYNDYLKYPDEDQQKSHHHCTVIDLEKSYKFYL